MNKLILTFKSSEAGTGELFAALSFNHFSGSGSCYFDTKTLLKQAKLFERYPMANDCSVCIEGGYFSESTNDLEQTHLHISARASDSLGNLKMRICLATPQIDEIYDFRAMLSCEIPTSYEKAREFSQAVANAVANDSVEFTIDF